MVACLPKVCLTRFVWRGLKPSLIMRICNFIEISEILIVVLCHRPGKMVTMISSSVGLKFVKKGIKNEKGSSREERGGKGAEERTRRTGDHTGILKTHAGTSEYKHWPLRSVESNYEGSLTVH